MKKVMWERATPSYTKLVYTSPGKLNINIKMMTVPILFVVARLKSKHLLFNLVWMLCTAPLLMRAGFMGTVTIT